MYPYRDRRCSPPPAPPPAQVVCEGALESVEVRPLDRYIVAEGGYVPNAPRQLFRCAGSAPPPPFNANAVRGM